MKLHRLEITAFGPFADTVHVDFDSLGADGLFLLHGRTGAGKTTILDAIAFALYGTVPGPRKEAKRLHSDHASPKTAPRVVLEATIGGRRLRVDRTPEYSRPKRRGDGVVTDKAKATLVWLDGHGAHLSRINEIGAEVGRLLGMSADQFFQVVLLPQGDFGRFLGADNDEREYLLERLFNTDRFASAEQWLLEQRRAGERDLERHRQSITRLIERIGATARVDDVPEHLESLLWSQELVADTKAEAVRADEELTARRAAAASAAARLAQARHTAELCRRRDDARRQLTEHAAGAAGREALVEELDRARRAEPVAVAIDDADIAVTAARRARTAATDAATALAAIDGGADAATEDSDLDACIRQFSADVGALDAIAEDVSVAAKLETELESVCRQLRDLEADSARIRDALAQLPARVAGVEARLRAAVEAEAALPGMVTEAQRLGRAAQAAAELGRSREECRRAGHDLTTARTDHVRTREHVVALRERRLAGMAAELAVQLAEGTACMVCGSPTHPSPAQPVGEPVTGEAEASALEAEAVAAARVEREAEALNTVRRAIDVLITELGEHVDTDADHLAGAAVNAEHHVAQARTQAAAVAPATDELAGLRRQDEDLHAELSDTEAAASAAAERSRALEQRLVELRARLAEVAGADGTIERRRARLNSLIAAAETLRRARTTVVAALDRSRQAAETVTARLIQAGFTDAAAAAAAVRPAPRHTAIEEELTAADRILAHATAVLAEPDIVALGEGEPDPLDELEAITAEHNSAVEQAAAVVSDAQRRVCMLDELSAQLWTALDHIAPIRRAQEELAALADVVAGRGENARQMSLRSYVLAARLEEVAQAASARLLRMSSGRYEFVHSDAAGPRRRRGGLGLDIRDIYTGMVRSSKTLSGGEKFMASLSLALGLADTVAAEAGGRMLDTIFIDEGFGSLDAAALDLVMDVLDELRAGGRTVGVVSHVDEMRRRIPSRLHVIHGRDGSRVQTSTGDLSV